MRALPIRHWIWILLALAAGAALRLYFIHAYPALEGDPLIYGDIAKNWLHGVFGITHVNGVRPTLLRLPGYPLFLAVCFSIFGVEHYRAVMYLQVAIDLASCLLIAGFVRRIWNSRAALIALWLAALCPFTANYTATPLTETLSIFCIAWAYYTLVRLLERPGWRTLVALAIAFSYATLLRPDGALLAVALCPAIVLYSRQSSLGPTLPLPRALKLAFVCGLLSILPFIPWTLRNWHTFHVFQPLAPRYAADPGEFTAPGFNRWTKTWCVEFASTEEIYWNGNTSALDINDLPARAFDGPAEYQQTKRLLDDYNLVSTLTPQIDARFAALAAQRIRGHWLRYYLQLPLARLADMWLRPRTEMLWIEIRWWEYSQHNAVTEFAAAYAALNLIYLLLALAGVFRRPPLLGAMLAYVVLRSLLLATLEAPEPRYTLECFPIVIALAAIALGGRRRAGLVDQPLATSAPPASSMSS